MQIEIGPCLSIVCPNIHFKGAGGKFGSGKPRWICTAAMLLTFARTNEFFSSDYYM